MKPRYLAALCILSLALATLAACSDAIFATIETETKTITSTLSTTISIVDMAVLPTIPPAQSTYYIAAGRVFQGQFANGSITWTPLSANSDTPFNPPGLFCNAMVYYPGTSSLYGGFSSSGGTYSLIQSQGSSSNPPYTFNGGTTITDPVIAGKQVVSLTAANGYLFVGATPDTNSYEIDYSGTGLPGSFASLISGSYNHPFTGVVWDGSNYWTATYTGSLQHPQPVIFMSPPGPFNFTVQALPPGFTADIINGVFADPVNHWFFMATKNSGVWYTNNGGATWVHALPDSQGNNPVSYLCVAGPLDYTSPTPDMYVVGADGSLNYSGGYGYYLLSVSGQRLARFSDSTKLLYTASVSKITVDQVTGNVLMGTNQRGLWRDTAADILSGTSNWVNE